MSNEMVLKIAKLPYLKYIHDYRKINICKNKYTLINNNNLKHLKMSYI